MEDLLANRNKTFLFNNLFFQFETHFLFFFYVYVIFICRYIQCAQTRKSKLLCFSSQHWKFIINIWKCTFHRWIIFYSSQTYLHHESIFSSILFSHFVSMKNSFLSFYNDLFANSRIFFISIWLKLSRLSL